MKILYCLFIITFVGYVFPFESHARPASQGLRTLSQPDGASFKARQWGDEVNHGWETGEGYTILLDSDTGKWSYAVNDEDGRLVSSGRVVGRDAPPEGIGKNLRPRKKTSEKIMRKAQIYESMRLVAPAIGVGLLPVVLVNFSDTETTYTQQQFSDMLFGTGSKTMNDYYKEVSYGNYSIAGEVVDWFKASNTHDYYGADDPYYSDYTDVNVKELVYDAVEAADAKIDFSIYDLDGDCKVDAVAIVHQGTDQANTGYSLDIWSHQGNIGGYESRATCKADPSKKITIDKYFIQNETAQEDNGPMHIATIGVYCHEYGHVLGLPDFYDTDYSSGGLGEWDAMAGGLNTVPGGVYEDTPAHFNPWSKYKLGWLTPAVVTTTLTDQQIRTAATDADVYRLGTGDSLSGEYFLVENRQKVGFDAGLPGAGLLIWHVDATWIDGHSEQNDVNNYSCVPPACSYQHYGVALVQADNKWDLERNKNSGDAADQFPGTSSKRSFDGNTSPNSNYYNGGVSFVTIKDISDPADIMTATLSVLPEYTLTVTKSGAGSGTVTATGLTCKSKTCSGTYNGGSSVTLTAAPATGSFFSGWSDGCDSVEGDTCTVVVSDNMTVTAAFGKLFQLTVKKNTGGTVTSDDEEQVINCGDDCNETYQSGTAVVLTAVPDDNSKFASWTGCPGKAANACTVNMSAKKTVTAKFRAKKQYTLKTVLQKGGTVSSDDSNIVCDATLKAKTCTGALKYREDDNTQVVLTAANAENYEFTGWSGGVCAGAETTCTVTITGSKTVKANFRKL